MTDLTIAEAAKHLGINPETLRTRIRRGQISARKDTTGQWRVHIPEAPAAEQAEPGQVGQSERPEPGRDNPETVAALLALIATMQRDHAREIQELHVLLQNTQRLIPATIPAATHAAEGAAMESPVGEAETSHRGAEREIEASQRTSLRSWWARLLGWE